MEIFDIRLLGFGEEAGADPAGELSRVFGVSPDKARAIVAAIPVLVKRGVDEATAERFFHILRGIGANVRIERRVEPSLRPPSSHSTAPPKADSNPPGPIASLPAPARGASARPPADESWGAAALVSSSLPGLEEDPFDDGSPLPVPDFTAVGLDAARYESVPPPSGATPNAMGPPPQPSPASVAPPSIRPGPSAPPPSPSFGPVASPPAAFFCESCNVTFSEAEVRNVTSNLRARPGLVASHACPRCRGLLRGIEGDSHGPLLPRLLGAFTYPFQRSAAAIFAGIAIVSAILSLFPIIGVFLAYGVQAIFFFRVIEDSGDGKDALPTGGEFIDLGDLIAPTFRFLLAMIVPFAPAALVIFALGLDNPLVIPAAAGLILLGLAYMPASVMIAALTGGCLGPLNPVAGVMIMTRVPVSYVITSIAVGVVILIDGVVMVGVGIATNLIPVPFIPSLIANAIGLVLPTIGSRMLGLFLHHHRHELGLGLD